MTTSGRRRYLLGGALALGLSGALLAAPPAGAADTTFSGEVDNNASSPAPKTAIHSITVSGAGTVSATLAWPAAAGTNLNLLLKDPSGVVVGRAESTTANPESLTATVSAAGTYKFNVIAAGTTGGAGYTLTTNYPGTTAPPGGLATYDTSFGFNGPAGIYAYGMDWDSTTNTMLTGDYWNYRVKRFNLDGTKSAPHVVSVVKPGGVLGGTNAPYDVEADLYDRNNAGEASLWSADQGSSRIVQFTQDGQWLQTIGRGGGGTDAAHPGANYAAGCGAGKMTIPTHMYVDPANGTLYVSDPSCRQVYMFTHTGGFIGQFNWAGSGLTAVIPRGLAAGPDGLIYVVEFNSRSVIAFNKNGTVNRVVAKATNMNDPRGLDIDQRNGDIVVVAAYFNEIFRFSSSNGALNLHLKTTNGINGGTPFDAIRFPAVDGDGNIYVGETWGTRLGPNRNYTGYGVLKFSPEGVRMPWLTGPDGPPDGGYNQQNGIAIDGQGSLHVVDTFEQRVQKFDTASSCVSAGNCPAWQLQFGSREPAGIQSKGFGYPRALTYGSGRNLIYVGDNNNAVLAWTPGGQFVHRFGLQGKAVGQFSGGVQGIQVTGGRIYTTDILNCRLTIWDEAASMTPGNTTGTVDTHMGTCGAGANQMTAPRGIAVGDAEGNANTVYVAETGNSRISRWNVATQTATQIRPNCAGVGLKQPWGVTWDNSRTWLYIGDVGNARIVRMNADGSVCQVVTTGAGVPEGKLKGTNFIEFDTAGRMYASDNNRRVYRFTITG